MKQQPLNTDLSVLSKSMMTDIKKLKILSVFTIILEEKLKIYNLMIYKSGFEILKNLSHRLNMRKFGFLKLFTFFTKKQKDLKKQFLNVFSELFSKKFKNFMKGILPIKKPSVTSRSNSRSNNNISHPKLSVLLSKMLKLTRDLIFDQHTEEFRISSKDLNLLILLQRGFNLLSFFYKYQRKKSLHTAFQTILKRTVQSIPEDDITGIKDFSHYSIILHPAPDQKSNKPKTRLLKTPTKMNRSYAENLLNFSKDNSPIPVHMLSQQVIRVGEVTAQDLSSYYESSINISPEKRIEKFHNKLKNLSLILNKKLPSMKSRHLHKFLQYDQALFQVFRISENSILREKLIVFQKILNFVNKRKAQEKILNNMLNLAKRFKSNMMMKALMRWRNKGDTIINYVNNPNITLNQDPAKDELKRKQDKRKSINKDFTHIERLFKRRLEGSLERIRGYMIIKRFEEGKENNDNNTNNMTKIRTMINTIKNVILKRKAYLLRRLVISRGKDKNDGKIISFIMNLKGIIRGRISYSFRKIFEEFKENKFISKDLNRRFKEMPSRLRSKSLDNFNQTMGFLNYFSKSYKIYRRKTSIISFAKTMCSNEKRRKMQVFSILKQKPKKTQHNPLFLILSSFVKTRKTVIFEKLKVFSEMRPEIKKSNNINQGLNLLIKIINSKEKLLLKESFFTLILHEHRDAFDSQGKFLRFLRVFKKSYLLKLFAGFSALKVHLNMGYLEFIISKQLFSQEKLERERYIESLIEKIEQQNLSETQIIEVLRGKEGNFFDFERKEDDNNNELDNRRGRTLRSSRREGFNDNETIYLKKNNDIALNEKNIKNNQKNNDFPINKGNEKKVIEDKKTTKDNKPFSHDNNDEIGGNVYVKTELKDDKMQKNKPKSNDAAIINAKNSENTEDFNKKPSDLGNKRSKSGVPENNLKETQSKTSQMNKKPEEFQSKSITPQQNEAPQFEENEILSRKTPDRQGKSLRSKPKENHNLGEPTKMNDSPNENQETLHLDEKIDTSVDKNNDPLKKPQSTIRQNNKKDKSDLTKHSIQQDKKSESNIRQNNIKDQPDVTNLPIEQVKTKDSSSNDNGLPAMDNKDLKGKKDDKKERSLENRPKLDQKLKNDTIKTKEKSIVESKITPTKIKENPLKNEKSEVKPKISEKYQDLTKDQAKEYNFFKEEELPIINNEETENDIESNKEISDNNTLDNQKIGQKIMKNVGKKHDSLKRGQSSTKEEEEIKKKDIKEIRKIQESEQKMNKNDKNTEIIKPKNTPKLNNMENSDKNEDLIENIGNQINDEIVDERFKAQVGSNNMKKPEAKSKVKPENIKEKDKNQEKKPNCTSDDKKTTLFEENNDLSLKKTDNKKGKPVSANTKNTDVVENSLKNNDKLLSSKDANNKIKDVINSPQIQEQERINSNLDENQYPIKTKTEKFDQNKLIEEDINKPENQKIEKNIGKTKEIEVKPNKNDQLTKKNEPNNIFEENNDGNMKKENNKKFNTITKGKSEIVKENEKPSKGGENNEGKKLIDQTGKPLKNLPMTEVNENKKKIENYENQNVAENPLKKDEDLEVEEMENIPKMTDKKPNVLNKNKTVNIDQTKSKDLKTKQKTQVIESGTPTKNDQSSQKNSPLKNEENPQLEKILDGRKTGEKKERSLSNKKKTSENVPLNEDLQENAIIKTNNLNNNEDLLANDRVSINEIDERRSHPQIESSKINKQASNERSKSKNNKNDGTKKKELSNQKTQNLEKSDQNEKNEVQPEKNPLFEENNSLTLKKGNDKKGKELKTSLNEKNENVFEKDENMNFVESDNKPENNEGLNENECKKPTVLKTPLNNQENFKNDQIIRSKTGKIEENQPKNLKNKQKTQDFNDKNDKNLIKDLKPAKNEKSKKKFENNAEMEENQGKQIINDGYEQEDPTLQENIKINENYNEKPEIDRNEIKNKKKKENLQNHSKPENIRENPDIKENSLIDEKNDISEISLKNNEENPELNEKYNDLGDSQEKNNENDKIPKNEIQEYIQKKTKENSQPQDYLKIPVFAKKEKPSKVSKPPSKPLEKRELPLNKNGNQVSGGNSSKNKNFPETPCFEDNGLLISSAIPENNGFFDEKGNTDSPKNNNEPIDNKDNLIVDTNEKEQSNENPNENNPIYEEDHDLLIPRGKSRTDKPLRSNQRPQNISENKEINIKNPENLEQNLFKSQESSNKNIENIENLDDDSKNHSNLDNSQQHPQSKPLYESDNFNKNPSNKSDRRPSNRVEKPNPCEKKNNIIKGIPDNFLHKKPSDLPRSIPNSGYNNQEERHIRTENSENIENSEEEAPFNRAFEFENHHDEQYFIENPENLKKKSNIIEKSDIFYENDQKDNNESISLTNKGIEAMEKADDTGIKAYFEVMYPENSMTGIDNRKLSDKSHLIPFEIEPNAENFINNIRNSKEYKDHNENAYLNNEALSKNEEIPQSFRVPIPKTKETPKNSNESSKEIIQISKEIPPNEQNLKQTYKVTQQNSSELTNSHRDLQDINEIPKNSRKTSNREENPQNSKESLSNSKELHKKPIEIQKNSREIINPHSKEVLLAQNTKEILQNSKKISRSNSRERSKDINDIPQKQSEIKQNQKNSKDLEENFKNQREKPENQKEIPQNQSEITQYQREISQNQREIPQNQREMPQNQRETPPNPTEIQKEMPLNQKEIPLNQKETVQNQKFISQKQQDILQNKREIPQKVPILNDIQQNPLEVKDFRHTFYTNDIPANYIENPIIQNDLFEKVSHFLSTQLEREKKRILKKH